MVVSQDSIEMARPQKNNAPEGIEMSDREQACETPLLDLLDDVPEDARAWYEKGADLPDSKTVDGIHSHMHIPYGLLCRRAAATIRTEQNRAPEVSLEMYETVRRERDKLSRELQSTVADANKWNHLQHAGYKQVAADAYYDSLHTMNQRIKDRVSAEMLAEIFRCMVVPAIDAVIERKVASNTKGD